MRCFRCDPTDSPLVVIVQKPLGNALCEKCGNARYTVIETLDFSPSEPPPEINEALLAGEIVEVMEQPTQEQINALVDETAVTFEEVDNMNGEELALMSIKLGLGDVEGESIKSIQKRIKERLKAKEK